VLERYNGIAKKRGAIRRPVFGYLMVNCPTIQRPSELRSALQLVYEVHAVDPFTACN
jgi:hypothetical protein